MSITLEELIKNREDLIEAHKKNNFTDGIHALLTDLYPDTAHFIYELLQNAEDMNATVVRFKLREDRIDFEHNGTKRTFNIADIDSITNIGHNSQKKDDLTSIGKFGVGFKAVFAYTATPIIHSGDYHFMIRDYFVPNFHDVEHVDTIDEYGVSWTKFSFPFNNPKKEKKDAFDECLTGLKALDSSTVLFLRNIKRIEYNVIGHGTGYAELMSDGEYKFIISCRKIGDKKETLSHWLRFERMVDIIDDQGNPKKLPVAIAFFMKKDSVYKKDVIVPVTGGGRTFIYFPAEKEYSGLRFHINAPFASTVARDSVRDCKDNVKLIKAISELICDSLPKIKKMNLMNHSFFEVLPNEKDHLSYFYQYIFDYIVSAFQKNAYIPAKNGGYISASEGLIGPAVISSVFREKDMESMFFVEKKWVANASQKNSNAYNFIQSLQIDKFMYDDFSKIFSSNFRFNTEKILKTCEKEWLKSFYSLCADVYENLDYFISEVYVRDMKCSKVIRSFNGNMYECSYIYILPVNETLVTKTTPIVDPFFIRSNKKDKACDKIYDLFSNILKIQDYGPKIEIEAKLKRIDRGVKLNDEYFKDMLLFAEYKKNHNDINFNNYEIFVNYDKKSNKTSFSKASSIFLGSEYGNDNGDILADVYCGHCLWDGYSNIYNEEELKQFIEFTMACGIKQNLKIEKNSARYNPLFYNNLMSNSKTTDYKTDFDWHIPNLKEFLKRKSIKISALIWETLERIYNDSKRTAVMYTEARYSPNKSAPVRKCDSYLIYNLKEYAWIPNINGELFKPSDISISELHPGFKYDSDNPLFEALNIGSAVDKETKEKEKAVEQVESYGFKCIPEDDYEDYMKYKQKKERIASSKDSKGLSSRELLDKQNKQSVANINGSDDFTTSGAVNNVNRREINIEKTFINAKQMKPVEKKIFSRTATSNAEEKKTLANWYNGKCQMCDESIIGFNGKPHFIARNIIDTRDLSSSIRQTTDLAWNSVCLCPNCSAKYQCCSRDLNGLYDQIMNTEIIEGDSERIILYIELDGKIQEISYIPKHFLALQTVMKLIDKETKE